MKRKLSCIKIIKTKRRKEKNSCVGLCLCSLLVLLLFLSPSLLSLSLSKISQFRFYPFHNRSSFTIPGSSSSPIRSTFIFFLFIFNRFSSAPFFRFQFFIFLVITANDLLVFIVDCVFEFCFFFFCNLDSRACSSILLFLVGYLVSICLILISLSVLNLGFLFMNLVFSFSFIASELKLGS